MPIQWLAVAAAGGLGSLARWSLGRGLESAYIGAPWATAVVNIIGCALFGVAVALFDGRLAHYPVARLGVLTGFLGGFTTFSSFAGEAVALLDAGRFGVAALSIVIQNIVGLASLWLGLSLGRGLA